MSLFKQDPLDAEIKRLEREQRDLKRQAERLSAMHALPAEPETPAPASPRPAKIVFDQEEEEQHSTISFQDRRKLKVQQKIARNRVITLAVIILILAVLAARSLDWIH